jgi:hypothetical protein
MYTRDLKVNYKNKCDRCGSWVNETDRYCPMCGYKAVEDFNPKFDNFSNEEFTQRLTNGVCLKNQSYKVKLNFNIPSIKYDFSITTNKSKLYIGTSPDCAIVLNRKFVSRFHAMLTYNFNTKKLFLSDNDSTNGTYVNDKRLSRGEIVELKQNDIIKLSNSFSIIYNGQEILI